jgi:putative membrane protein
VTGVLYLFCKWLHLIAVISWMAGILYLYRLYVNHSEHGHKPDNHELLTGMEYRLYRYITRPAMVVAWLAGLGMIALNTGLLQLGWLHAKLFCLVLLTAATIYAGRLQRRFAARDAALPTSRQLRLWNEVPTLLMLVIVGLAVFRPF